ncbi:MAG: hypothetical protein EYC70_16875 [Planctomycetota bacterium]|nr:MAG: hypothetical protein EYC70_16875 [Planctomycetota bacterium]
MPKLIRTLSLLALAIPACVVPSDARWGGVHANGYAAGYYSNLGGSVSTRTQAGGGSTSGSFNVDRVGQGSHTLSSAAEVRAGFAPLELALSGFDYSETADGSFNGAFLGQQFSGAVQSDFDVRAVKATGGLDVVNNGQFRVGALVGGHYLDADISLTDSGSGASARFDDQVIVPVVGVRADVAILPEILRAGGEITGMDVKVDEYDATFFDMMAAIYYTPVRPVEAVLGWRYTSMELDGDFTSKDSVTMDLEFSGPFLGVGLSF